MNTAKKHKPPVDEAQITNSSKYGIEFMIVSDRELSHSQIGEAQRKAGYHPDGYGMYGLKVKTENDVFVHTWGCSSTCD